MVILVLSAELWRADTLEVSPGLYLVREVWVGGEADCGCGEAKLQVPEFPKPEVVFTPAPERAEPSLLPDPGDNWIPPAPVDTSSSTQVGEPELDVDTFGNLWVAAWDGTNNAVNLYYSLDDGITWTFFGTVSVSGRKVWDFGFKIDQGTNLFHFSLITSGYWESPQQCTPYFYCPDFGQTFNVCTYWYGDEYGSNTATLQVSYSGGVPQNASVLYSGTVESGVYTRDWHYWVDPSNNCYVTIYDTLHPAEGFYTDLAFEREGSPNYGFAAFSYDITRWANTSTWYYTNNLGNNITNAPESSFVLLSRTTDGGASWEGYSSAKKLGYSASGNYYRGLSLFAGNAQAVHLAALDDQAKAYYFRSTDRGASWSSPTVENLARNGRDVAVAQAYGGPYVLWLIDDSSNVIIKYSRDQGSSWTSYTYPSAALPAVYPDGEEDVDATSEYFYMTLYKGGNALFKIAPVNDADQLGDWFTPPSVDSLAIATTSPAYPVLLDYAKLDEIAFVWNGQYAPGIAWTHQASTWDTWFTRPTQPLGVGASPEPSEPLRLISTLPRSTLLFSGPVIGKVLKLYDASGRLAFKAELGSRRVQVSLKPGVYVWELGGFRGKLVLK